MAALAAAQQRGEAVRPLNEHIFLSHKYICIYLFWDSHEAASSLARICPARWLRCVARALARAALTSGARDSAPSLVGAGAFQNQPLELEGGRTPLRHHCLSFAMARPASQWLSPTRFRKHSV